MRQAIELDKHIERIMELECVTGVKKSYDGAYIFRLDKSFGDELPNVANEGDVLIQDSEGRWHHVDRFEDESLKHITT